jgi:hypothetical protein
MMFSQLPEPTPVPETDKYVQNYRTAIEHLADCLFDLLLARRLARVGKTGLKHIKTSEPVIKEGFKARLTKGKPSNYPHQFWAGVSTIMK